MKVHENVSTTEENVEDYEENKQELETIAEDLNLEIIAKEVENIVMVNKTVDKSVDNTNKAMNPDEESDDIECHECVCKDQVVTDYMKLLYEKESTMVEKTAAYNGRQKILKKMTSERT